MKKGICLYAFLALLACGGFLYTMRPPADTLVQAALVPAATQAPAQVYTQVLEPLSDAEEFLRVSIFFDEPQTTLVIERAGADYALTAPVEAGVPAKRFESYIGAAFSMQAMERAGDEAPGDWETRITLETTERTVSLNATAPHDGACLVTVEGTGDVYRVALSQVAWRGASVPTLTGRLFEARDAEEVEFFDMETPDGAYHFIRTSDGVTLGGEEADKCGFESMLETLFTLPLTYAPDVKNEQAVITIALGYEDGQSDTLRVYFDAHKAYMTLPGEQTFYTDAWRINALMLACDGARVV